MYNKVLIIGRVGATPEIKRVNEDLIVAKFSVATNSFIKKNGEEKTVWFDINTFNKLADIVEKFVCKGQLIYIEGTMDESRWVDDSGNARKRMFVNASNIRFLEPKKENISDETFDDQDYKNPF